MTTKAIADARCEKKFADDYREETEKRELENITGTTLRHHTVDFTYRTHAGVKTVRSMRATESASYNNNPDGFYSFYEDGSKYAFNPEENRLISINDEQNHTLATEEDIVHVEEVKFPTRAAVVGGVETDVEATVYYRSPQSDQMQSMTVEVGYMDGNKAQSFRGTEVGTGKRIEATTKWEREISRKHGAEERTLGKVTRVEFPRGHRFSVEVEGISDSKAEDSEESIRRQVKSAFRYSDSINVTHEGRLEWD